MGLRRGIISRLEEIDNFYKSIDIVVVGTGGAVCSILVGWLSGL